MAAHLVLLSHLPPRDEIAFDGLRSCVTSQDYPCDITTVVDRPGDTILTMTHAIFRRGGTMTTSQRRRMVKKERVWQPPKGGVSKAIARTYHEIWDYLRPSGERRATIDTDENPMYRTALRRDAVGRHYQRGGLISHILTPGSAPRTRENRLFPVNYIDRLLRHRVKEHTRETIAIGRNATMQMSRAWIFAWDHNGRRPHRVREAEGGVHAVHGGVAEEVVRGIERGFYTRRIRASEHAVPESIREVWLGRLASPPVRWRVGQRGTSVRIPRFARRDIGEG